MTTASPQLVAEHLAASASAFDAPGEAPASDEAPPVGARRGWVAAVRRSTGRALGVAACAALAAWAIVFEQITVPERLPLFLFFAGLSLLSILLPASGPRGQRVGLIPAVGLAALLLLPPLVAILPLVLANTAYAFTLESPHARRGVYERGVWLLLAMVLGGLLHSSLHGARPWNTPHTPLELVLVPLCYAAVFAGGRLFSLSRHFRAGRTVRRHAWVHWRLEAVTLAVTAPVSVLMAVVYPTLGVAGVGGAAVLLGLLLLVAHFGFEVVLLHEQVRAMEKLSAVTVSQATTPKVAERFLSLSAGLVSCDRAALWLTDDSRTRLERLTPAPARAGAPAESPAAVRFGEGLVGRVAESKADRIVRDGAHDPRLTPEEQRRAPAPFAMLLLPLVAGDETVGVAQFERDAPGAFSRRDLARVRALAAQAAATLANVRSHRDVYNQAVTDGLTGLFNRRHIQAVLLDERRRAQRYGHPLSVIMLDVDGFKVYNDTYGHVQGDALLRMLAAILRGAVRAVDVVGRFGGEEFIVVLPETPASEAFQAAERLRLAVARTVFPGFPADPDLAVFKTISLGVATSPDVPDDARSLVQLADDALYQAKRGGRNRTVQATGRAE